MIIFLPKHRIQKHIACQNWEDAIHQSCSLLEKDGIVTSEYGQASINAIYKYGPYFVIAPQIMLVHARPQEGALKNGLAFISLNSEIECQGVSVKYIFALSATGDGDHIELIQLLSSIIDCDDIYTILENNPESLENLFDNKSRRIE